MKIALNSGMLKNYTYLELFLKFVESILFDNNCYNSQIFQQYFMKKNFEAEKN